MMTVGCRRIHPPAGIGNGEQHVLARLDLGMSCGVGVIERSIDPRASGASMAWPSRRARLSGRLSPTYVCQRFTLFPPIAAGRARHAAPCQASTALGAPASVLAERAWPRSIQLRIAAQEKRIRFSTAWESQDESSLKALGITLL
jgi:hypothetical protein